MTLPNGSNNPPISLGDIQAEFNLGTNLSSYRSQRWFKDDNSRGYFADTSSAISFADFYSKRKNSPVVASGPTTLSRATYNNTNYAYPMFNNFYVSTYSGQGGTAGVNGNCANGTAGGVGAATNFGGSATTGTGSPGPNGGSGSVSSSSTNLTISDANQASILALYGTTKLLSIGAKGGAGTTGYNSRSVFTCVSYVYYYGVPVCNGGVTDYYCDSAVGAGIAGADGYIVVQWN
jgi:hypothetical protein